MDAGGAGPARLGLAAFDDSGRDPIMAQGLRGRLAVLGAGMLFCTGLVGCMDNDSKSIKGPSKPTTPGTFGSTVKPNQPAPGSTYGTGTPSTGFNQTGARTPPNNNYPGTG